MKTRMWIVETDQYDMTDRKFYIDDPVHVPHMGKFGGHHGRLVYK